VTVSSLFYVGLLPDGGVWLEGGEEEREGARLCWQEREREVLTTLVNTSITAADFETALKVKEQCKERGRGGGRRFSPPCWQEREREVLTTSVVEP
jgi:hypothetical protein